MKELCATSPFPIALDEELIGVNETEQKIQLLDTIRPHYIILKPSLHGGIQGSKEWITLAQERGIGYWVTSIGSGKRHRLLGNLRLRIQYRTQCHRTVVCHSPA